MGRQIQILAGHGDCWNLIDHIRSNGPAKVFRNFATSKEGLFYKEREHSQGDRTVYYVWLTGFTWEPIYSQTGGPLCPPERAGLYYVSNVSSGPILEISTSVERKDDQGRVYWAKVVGPDGRFTYDEPAFDRLVTRVFKHIQKVGTRGGNDALRIYDLRGVTSSV